MPRARHPCCQHCGEVVGHSFRNGHRSPCRICASKDVCSHGDPTCPCPDGLVCHYAATETTAAMTPPSETEEVYPR